ncbi:rCG37930 [Rattus norvegicus]|uniref:RCG37930 n=1 Tax=Rattus norvegicus TaxID=10116 RepID=A6K612_RAT|nr:rCG37930 [Rattus norvegicus]
MAASHCPQRTGRSDMYAGTQEGVTAGSVLRERFITEPTSGGISYLMYGACFTPDFLDDKAQGHRLRQRG